MHQPRLCACATFFIQAESSPAYCFEADCSHDDMTLNNVLQDSSSRAMLARLEKLGRVESVAFYLRRHPAWKFQQAVPGTCGRLPERKKDVLQKQ